MSVSPVVPPNRSGRRAVARNRGGALGAAGVLAVGSAGALLAAFAGSAGAASTLTVDSNADGAATAANCTDGTPGNCTLRDAAAQANDGDTINFDAGITSINLTAGAVNLRAVQIIGTGSANLTVTTTGAAGAYDTFNLGGTGDVTISGITITKNRVTSTNDGNLTLDDVTITGSTGTNGGALFAYNRGDLDITGSTFADNAANYVGGAINANNSGTVTITGSIFTNNDAGTSGGAVYAYNEDIEVTDSTFTGNSAVDKGGGLRSTNNGAVTITRTTIADNSSVGGGGGLDIGVNGFAGGAVLIDSSTISGNISSASDGGGLYFRSVGGFTMLNSTVSGNSAYDGAGMELSDVEDVVIANSTIANNTGDANQGDGGALYFRGYLTGDVEILFTTISGNSSNSNTIKIFSLGEFSVGMTGVAISDNTTSAGSGILATDIVCENSASGTLTLNNSLVMGAITTPGLAGGGNLLGVSAKLGPLVNNGGATKTMAPLAGSPAVDSGPLTWTPFAGDGFDQRATPYLRFSGTSADMGAYEVQPEPEPTTTTTIGVDPVVPAFTG